MRRRRLSERAINFAKEFNPELDFYTGSADDIDGEYDIAIAAEVLEHVPDERVSEFIVPVAKKTKPGGVAIFTVPTTNVRLNRKHYRHYDASIIKQQIEASGAPLTIEKVEYIFHLPWWLRVYSRLCSNSILRIEFPFLSKSIWGRVWKKHRRVGAGDGRHLLAVTRKLV